MSGRKNTALRKILWLLPVCICAAGCRGSEAAAAETPAAPTATETPATPTRTPIAGDVRTDARGIEQVWVEPGTFRMGTGEESLLQLLDLSPPPFVSAEFKLEQPPHEVRVTRGYWIDKYEVNNRSFREFVDAGGYTAEAYWSAEGWEWLLGQPVDMLPMYCQGNVEGNPAACVTWYEAEAYARWRGGRLPTEAEWEYAARGPQSLVYPWGNDFDPSLCNMVDGTGLMPIGSYPAGASWVGAEDMAGNVMEWVQDWLGPYAEDPAVDPAGPETGRVKVEKGGWWGAPFFTARSAYRHFEDPPGYQDAHIGFRVISPL